MFKVFLVEDEIVVREGIKNNINWEENGFNFCGEASDGELAYPMIQKIKPDIVITDIRMPFMDGLELSRLIKKEIPGIKIIILSGYGEFEYAKVAINIGITEYLLKPINATDLMKCMKQVREDIIKEQEELAYMDKFKREMKEYETDERRRLFNDMVGNTKTLASILERGKELNLELSAMVYNIALFTMNISRQHYEDNLMNKVQVELEEILEAKEDVIQFEFSIEGMLLLFKGSNLDDIHRIQDKYINQIKQIMENYKSISYFGGLGTPVKRLGELPSSFHEASRAFAYRYIWDINEIVDSSTISEEGLPAKRSCGVVMPNLAQLDKKKVEGFLKSGSKDDIHYFVEEYLRSIGKENRKSLIFRQYMVMDMYYIVVGFLEELGYGADFPIEPYKDNSQFNLLISSFEFMKHYIEKIFTNAIDLRDEVTTKHYSDIINKAKVYINENYMNEEISLNLVSASIFISPSHFCAIFSQKTGQTFIKYLTDLRMNKAKELLKCTDLRASDVGYSVGYKDPHYFSYLFKKTQNCTPKQYRFSSQQREVIH